MFQVHDETLFFLPRYACACVMCIRLNCHYTCIEDATRTHTAASCATCSAVAAKGSYPWQNPSEGARTVGKIIE